MWDRLTWRGLNNPGIAEAMTGLREDSLRFFLRLTIVGYLLWHFVVLLVLSHNGLSVEVEARYWVLFLIVLAGLVGTDQSLRRKPELAVKVFIISNSVSLIAAMWLLASPLPLLLLPFLVISSVILLNPLAGVLVGTGTLAGIVVLSETESFVFLTSDRLSESVVSCLLAIAVAWALGGNLVASVGWTLTSYDQAIRNMQTAQSHRAELVRALKQLDNAYYRLERANASLALAWKAAEAAERSKIEFVTNISHELRTPLNLIVGFSEMIVTSPESYEVSLPVEYRGDLNAIYRSAEHLLALTQDVLDLARVGAGRMALAREPVNLGQIIDDAGAIVREYVEAKGLALSIKLPPDLPQMMLDRLRIRQVVLNLLTNAARFTQRGSIEVSATCEKRVATIRVKDTGSGIPPGDLPKVFDEFYHTGDDPTAPTTSFRGVGLGLSLSKRFVELHDGEMGVESVVNAGTTFWVRLPIGRLDRGSADPADMLPRPAFTTRKTEQILTLCSPDVRLGPFLQHHLRDYRVIVAPDLTVASSLAVRYRSTAILADIEVELPAVSADLPVPLIRLPLPSRDRMAAALGVSAYLVKPVSRNDLHAAIERLGKPIRKIVLADDDEGFTRLMTRLLHPTPNQSPGVEREIVVAHNGMEALDLLEAFRPDLLLLDLVMPGFDGHRVLDALASVPHLHDIPVIVVSAQDENQEQLPLDGVLSILKPEGFRFEELLSAVDGLLRALEPPRRYLTMTSDQDHSELEAMNLVETE